MTKHMEKRAIGRNIGRRGHAMIQTKNTATGQVEEDQDIEDMEEGETDLPVHHWILIQRPPGNARWNIFQLMWQKYIVSVVLS